MTDPKFLLPGAPASKNNRTITVVSELGDGSRGSRYHQTGDEQGAVGFAQRAAARGAFGSVIAFLVVEGDKVLHRFPIVKKGSGVLFDVKPEHKAFVEGVTARLNGATYKDNPYNYEGSQQDYDLWARGYGLTPRAEDLEIG